MHLMDTITTLRCTSCKQHKPHTEDHVERLLNYLRGNQ